MALQVRSSVDGLKVQPLTVSVRYLEVKRRFMVLYDSPSYLGKLA